MPPEPTTMTIPAHRLMIAAYERLGHRATAVECRIALLGERQLEFPIV